MADQPQLTTVPNIHLASVGHWEAMTGSWDCTPDDLVSMVEAEADPAVRAPVLKLGHIDPRFDGQPAVGRIANLRLSEDGMDLYGDALGVPKWLADVWGSAFPSRSIEASLNVTDSVGRKHKAILTGLALLGVKAPAIETLDDIRALYEGDLVAAAAQAATGDIVQVVTASTGESRMPKWLARLRRQAPQPVALSVAIDDVYTEFYEAVPDGSYAWIRQVYSDFVIVDDGEGDLFQIPWSEVDGEVVFGDPVPGKMVFVPGADDEADDSSISLAGDREGALALLSHSPDVADQRVRLAAGVPANTTTQEESLDIQDLLAEVGLPADATQEQYRERLTELAQVAAAGATDDPGTPSVTVPEGMALVDSGTLQELQASAAQGHQAFVALATQRRDSFIESAVRCGKVPPARREHYAKMWDADEEGTRSLLDSMAEGLVPTSVLAGHTESADVTGDDALYSGLFGSEEV